jgi:hypothetical protein
MSEALRYPLGRFTPPAQVSPAELRGWVDDLERFPADFRLDVEALTDDQLAERYRPGGWTLRQVVHHVPDSHVNAYVRCKWALTEENPAIKTYFEARWAELPDVAGPVALSLALLDAVHARWVTLFRGLDGDAVARTFVHPEWGAMSVAALAGMYAWHGRHHQAHLRLVTGAAAG